MDDFCEIYRLKYEEWAKLDGYARKFEEMRPVLRAEIRQQSTEKTEAAKESYSHAHPKYREHIEKMVVARTKANICKAQVRAIEMQADIWRTKESSRRAEMGLAGR